MIRPATLNDAAAIQALIVSQHERSKFAGRANIAPRALENLILGLIASNNQNGPQGTYVVVNEEGGKVVGFIAGQLARLYGILDKLGATDVFLINEGRAGASLYLIDGYIQWARANPKVLDIELSWNDTLPGADKIAKLYTRKGFTKTGETYTLSMDAVSERLAA